MNNSKRYRRSLAVSIIGNIVLLLVIIGLVVSILGVVLFTESFKKEYAVTTYHMADTATALINGDNLDAYLSGEKTEDYLLSKGYLDSYCDKMSVSLIYVIQVDRSDYGRFVSVFNSVNNEVDNTSYTAWELGHKRDTTNNEYRRKYEAIYNKESAYETVYRLKTTDGQHPHITTMVPVKNSEGDVTGILCMQRPSREITEARRPYLRSIALTTAALAVVASLVSLIYNRSQFIIPVQKINDEAARFAKENTKGEDLGNISRIKELYELARSIDTMESEMVTSIENLKNVTAEKERIGTELSLAQTIQENSIPNIFPPFPGRNDFDIYASMQAAREVGGDFYNFFFVDDDHLSLVIGDVSGKGIPASLFMMVTNILITDRTNMGGTPGEILTYVNKKICEHNRADMFVTVWLGILELSTGKLIASNAGHEYPAIKRAVGDFEIFKDKHGFVIGSIDDIKCKDYELTLSPGDKLFVYTDGVREARDKDGELFGTKRMLEALNEAADVAPEEILGNVSRAVDVFVKEEEQFDDLTMLCIEYKGKGNGGNDD
ncbi:MAG: PP2C family protein-serine/threonine phosphatase [Clostridia bacterium]|nr:PP2C family protein-serine/threonine phosphatase [Clostridia bacterium]